MMPLDRNRAESPLKQGEAPYSGQKGSSAGIARCTKSDCRSDSDDIAMQECKMRLRKSSSPFSRYFVF